MTFFLYVYRWTWIFYIFMLVFTHRLDAAFRDLSATICRGSAVFSQQQFSMNSEAKKVELFEGIRLLDV